MADPNINKKISEFAAAASIADTDKFIIARAGTPNTNLSVTGAIVKALASTPTPAGSNTQVQFNDGGALGAHSGITYDKTTSTLTVANLTGKASSVAPAGADTQVQFNDGGVSAGNSGLTFNKATGTLTVTNLSGNASTATSATSATSATTSASVSGSYMTVGQTYSGTATIVGNNVVANTATADQMLRKTSVSGIGMRAIRMHYDEGITFHTVQSDGSAGDVFSQERVRIGNDGVVKVVNLSGTGNRAVYSDGSGNLTNTSSDEQLKTDIFTISESLNVLEALGTLRGVYYKWNRDVPEVSGLGEQREIGVIAQEVETVLPEVVGMNGNGYKSVDYAKLTAFLIEVSKAQQSQIVALKNQISVLATGLSALVQPPAESSDGPVVESGDEGAPVEP